MKIIDASHDCRPPSHTDPLPGGIERFTFRWDCVQCGARWKVTAYGGSSLQERTRGPRRYWLRMVKARLADEAKRVEV